VNNLSQATQAREDMNEHSKPPFPKQRQPMPGRTAEMRPAPDHGEHSYRGCGRLSGKKAIITGADSGIGRAVAIAYAREGADVLIAYLNEHDDAQATQRLVEEAGRKAILVPGDVQSAKHCRGIIEKAVANSAASTSWSTMRRIRRLSPRSKISPTRSGSEAFRSTSTRCFI
jgi:hypothetical protein